MAAAETPAPDARDEQERAAAEGDQQRRARQDDRQDLVDVAHDRALGAEDLDRGRRGVLGRARGTGVVDRRVAGLGRRGDGLREVGGRVADLHSRRGLGAGVGGGGVADRLGAGRGGERRAGGEPEDQGADAAATAAMGLHGDLLWVVG